MSDKIISCFYPDQPDFYREVTDADGRRIATIRALTPEDDDLINRRAGFKMQQDDSGVMQPSYDAGAYENYHLLLSLGGRCSGRSYQYGSEGLCGPDGARIDLDEQNVNRLHPALRGRILQEILALKRYWLEQREGLLKN